jgi:hypothetical protein
MPRSEAGKADPIKAKLVHRIAYCVCRMAQSALDRAPY